MTKRAIWINILKVVGGLLVALIIGYFIFTTGQVQM